MYCVKCGNAISLNAKFCKSCGVEIRRRNRVNHGGSVSANNLPPMLPSSRKADAYAQQAINKNKTSALSPRKLIAAVGFGLAFVIVAVVATGIFLSGRLPVTARLVNIHNVDGYDVTLAREPGGRSVTPRSGQSIHSGSILNTGRNSFVYLQLDGTSMAKMDEVSRVSVSTLRNVLALNVQQGELFVEVEQLRPVHTLQVLIGHTTFSVRGTSFIIGYRQYDSANVVFVTMLSGYGAMHIPGVEDEVLVQAGETLLVIFEQLDDEWQYVIRAIDINYMSLFELREIYRRRHILHDAGFLTQQQVWQIPERIIHREVERAEMWARQDAIAGILPVPAAPTTPVPVVTPQPISDSYKHTTEWKLRNAKIIAAGTHHTAAMNADGTVVSEGRRSEPSLLFDDADWNDMHREVSEWRDIVAISAGGSFERGHTVGLRANGTVAVAGRLFSTWFGGSLGRYIESWRDIIAVSTGG